ncbi:MAG: ACP S-malonyltransferase [Acholeplasmataceae bacterium]|nr:ACP S-malonyltransferase [Acholeplasmataceae bacterium]
MNKLAICFSGQGSQYQFMGLDYIEASPKYKQMEKEASSILGFDVLSALSDDNLINQTRYTQPLIVLKSIFGFDMVKLLNPQIEAYLGFSLGEYSAYYAANIFNFKQLFEIITKRAAYMEADTKKTEGLMAAVIGLQKEEVKQVCLDLQKEGIIDIANDNAPSQLVISGEKSLIQKAAHILKELGARRVIELKTSGAFHTSLMSDASQKLKNDILTNKDLTPLKSSNKMYMNFDAQCLNDLDILNHIEKQMTHEVKFRESILNMKKDGITHILEIGPGKVLTNLIQKIDPLIETMNFDKEKSYEIVKGWLNTHGFTK